jgi:hypothetical protein
MTYIDQSSSVRQTPEMQREILAELDNWKKMQAEEDSD